MQFSGFVRKRNHRRSVSKQRITPISYCRLMTYGTPEDEVRFCAACKKDSGRTHIFFLSAAPVAASIS
jgi:hypothetical protein